MMSLFQSASSSVNGDERERPQGSTLPNGYTCGADPLGESYDHKIRPVIDLVNNLRGCGLNQELDLPRVVVVGDQSSGKSSILEAMSGVELPRGKGIVTRCPLVLEMKRRLDWKATISYPNMREGEKDIETPEEVSNAIDEAQRVIAGGSKGISNTPITLKIASPAAPDLTLIDLPGLTRLAIADQASDAPEQIRQMVEDQVSQPNTLILCVAMGNLDLAVNESIKIAKKHDPQGVRTIGVITKADLIDSNEGKTDVMKILRNEIVPLKKGYVLVKCRSSDDMLRRMTLREAAESEAEFFERDPIFRHADQSMIGIKKLSYKLTENLVELIKRKIPEIKERVMTLRIDTRKELDSIPKGPPVEVEKRRAYLMKLIGKFMKRVEECVVNGSVKKLPRDEDTPNSFKVWRENFQAFSEQLNKLTKDLMNDKKTTDKILEEIHRRRGPELSTLFISFEIIRDPVHDHLKAYCDPAFLCLKDISLHLEQIMNDIVHLCFSNLEELKFRVQTISDCARLDQERKTEDQIIFHFKEEKIIFVQDSYLADEFKKVEEEEAVAAADAAQQPPGAVNPMHNAHDGRNAKEIFKLMTAYLNIANRRLADQIPACILRCMHKEYVKILRDRLEQELESDAIIGTVCERPEVFTRRTYLQDRLERLEKGELMLAHF